MRTIAFAAALVCCAAPALAPAAPAPLDAAATPLDEAHGFEPHDALHPWVHRDSPHGVYQVVNPAVSCPAAHDPHASRGSR